MIPSMVYTLRSETRTGGEPVRISLPRVDMLLDLPRYSLPPGGQPMKMSQHDNPQTEIERRKLTLMRQVTAAASSRTNLRGIAKTRGMKQKPVTLPAADALKRIRDDDE